MTQLTISAVNISRSIAYGPSQSTLMHVPCVEISLSDGSVFKGDCLLTGAESTPPATLTPLTDGLTHTLVGQSLDDYLHLCRLASQSQYTLSEMRYPDLSQKSADERQKDNRREMLSMLGVLEKEEPQLEPTDVSYPLPRHMIRGATIALLHACAHAKNRSMDDYLADLMPNGQKGKRPPLGVHVDFAEQGPLLEHASALCYAIPPVADSKSLGKEVEKFQQYLRQLNNWINDNWENFEPEDRPTLFVDLNGAIHRINKESSGKTLGSLFGFGTTGNQEKMIFSNVITGTSASKTAGDHALMQSMMKSRKLKMTLAAGCWTNSLENVQTWLEKAKPSLIALHMHETASIGELIEMITIIKTAKTEFVLQGNGCGNLETWGVVHQIAQAAGPVIYIPSGNMAGLVQAINR